MKKTTPIFVILSCLISNIPSWGMDTVEEFPCMLFQNLLPEPGESYQSVIAKVNSGKGDAQSIYLVKKWVYNLFISPELLGTIQLDKLINLNEIDQMNDVEMYSIIRLLSERSWKEESWVPLFVERLKTRAKQGIAAAENNLGLYYGNTLGVHEQFGININFKESADWFTKSAVKNNPYAQHNIGLLFRDGRIIDGKQKHRQDLHAAKNWMKMSAEQGQPLAQVRLALLLDDKIEAFKLMSKAAKTDCYMAHYQLGTMYEFGEGVDQNIEEALCFYKKAAQQSFFPAQRDLGLINFSMGLWHDAYEWLTIAQNNNQLKRNDVTSRYIIDYYLGFLNEEGLGGAAKDSIKANQLYKSAEDIYKQIQLENVEFSEIDYFFPLDQIAEKYEQGGVCLSQNAKKAKCWYLNPH